MNSGSKMIMREDYNVCCHDPTGVSLVSFVEKNSRAGSFLTLFLSCFIIGRFNMYLDDLPVCGELVFLSGGEDGPISVYTHKKLSISYNGPYIVEVRLTEEGVVELQDNKEIEFTYEVCVMEMVFSPFSFFLVVKQQPFSV